MQIILKFADQIWNLRFIKGYRTRVAQWLIAAVGAYQWASTAKEVTGLVNLPDLSTPIASALLVYLAAKVKQFANEHQG